MRTCLLYTRHSYPRKSCTYPHRPHTGSPRPQPSQPVRSPPRGAAALGARVRAGRPHLDRRLQPPRQRLGHARLQRLARQRLLVAALPAQAAQRPAQLAGLARRRRLGRQRLQLLGRRPAGGGRVDDDARGRARERLRHQRLRDDRGRRQRARGVSCAAQRVRLQQLVGALLDDAQVRQHVGLAHAALVAQQLAHRGRVAPDAREQLPDNGFERVHRVGRRLQSLLVHLGLRLHRRQPLLHVACGAHLGAVHLGAAVAVAPDLAPDHRRLVLKLLHLGVDLVHVVEQRVVLVLRADEPRHQRVNVLDARRGLDLLKRLPVHLHLLRRHVLRQRLVGSRARAGARGAQPAGALARRIAGAARPVEALRRDAALEQLLRLALAQRQLGGAHALPLALVVLDDLRQRAPLVLEPLLLALRLRHERAHLRHRALLELVDGLRGRDRVRHVALELGQLALQVGVDGLKHDALAPQVVDLLAQRLVVRDGGIVLDRRLLQPVLKQLDALLHADALLLGGVDAAHERARRGERLAHEPQLLVQHARLAHLQHDLASEVVALIL
mmetsp:Transcript_26036/g.66221  ORF Transcript_26036/g.66221 Transcript_26036/m.66221 type:complete len:556 (-) Transcript_26036:392-2059(-)